MLVALKSPCLSSRRFSSEQPILRVAAVDGKALNPNFETLAPSGYATSLSCGQGDGGTIEFAFVDGPSMLIDTPLRLAAARTDRRDIE